MSIRLELISGFIIGFQWMSLDKAAMVNLGIIRILFDWYTEE